LAALCLCLASPPGAFPFAAWLVLPGLAFLYRVVSSSRRAALGSYLVGAVYMATFSWSVRHVLFAAYAGIVLVGGLYFAILPRWVKGLAGLRLSAPLAFGVAIAGTHWLRAHMPEIGYPHGQPAHVLYRVPAVLEGPAAVGGEELLNLLLAVLAALVVDIVGGVHRRVRFLLVAATLFVWGGTTTWAHVRAARQTDPLALNIAAIQPGLIVEDMFERDVAKLVRRQQTTLVQPTLAVAGPDAASPPDLVLWPESTAHVELLIDADARPQLARARWWCTQPRLKLAPASKFLVGGFSSSPAHEGVPVAILLDHQGELLGQHEKQRLVPGGERQPFLDWLPAAWSAWLREALEQKLGAALHLEPGSFRAPLEVTPGVRVGSLLCYDNAYPGVTRDYVAAGANVLAVLSNEVWYLRGAELDQMEAMTVLRALEAGVPIVRATVDGTTLTVDARGRVQARVAVGGTHVLRLRVAVPRSGGPVAPVAPALAWVCALSLVLAFLQQVMARLRRT
jgi:apolipoprotein N-acyltransferase